MSSHSDATLPIRKSIRLRDFDYSSNGAYFITICTHNRAHLFGEVKASSPDVGAHLCVRPHRPDLLVTKWLFEIERKFEAAALDAYTVMPDHIHFILLISSERQSDALPEIIKWFKTQTTNEYIRLVKSGKYPPFDKHIWQRNYFEHILRSETDLQETRTYIEENLLRWLARQP